MPKRSAAFRKAGLPNRLQVGSGSNAAPRTGSAMRRSTSMSILPKDSQRSWRASCPSGVESGSHAMPAPPRDRVFPVETSIHHRPSEINDRSQFGNWEGEKEQPR